MGAGAGADMLVASAAGGGGGVAPALADGSDAGGVAGAAGGVAGAGGGVAGCASDAAPDCAVAPAEVVVGGAPVESRPAVEDMLGWAGVVCATAAPASSEATAAPARKREALTFVLLCGRVRRR